MQGSAVIVGGFLKCRLWRKVDDIIEAIIKCLIVPVMQDPSKSVQDHTLFSFDDVFFVPPTAPNSHIRAMREGDWTYATYFSLDGGGGKPADSAKGGNAGAMAKSMPPGQIRSTASTGSPSPALIV